MRIAAQGGQVARWEDAFLFYDDEYLRVGLLLRSGNLRSSQSTASLSGDVTDPGSGASGSSRTIRRVGRGGGGEGGRRIRTTRRRGTSRFPIVGRDWPRRESQRRSQSNSALEGVAKMVVHRVG